MRPKPVFERRLVILGFRSVGKSSLSLQFTENRFPDSYDPTIENTFTKEFTFHNQRYLMQLHDTSGQDEFSMFPINCSIGIHGYVLVYAINSRKSFDVVKVIYDKILDTVGCVSEQERDVANIPIILVGNKSDLDDRVREVTYDEGKKTADKWKAAFMETTARNNEAIILLFILISVEFLKILLFFILKHQVKEVFQQILYQIEKANGNIRRPKETCSLS
ncbi:GTP-binding protein Rheb [Trichinella sp. T8]|nr:GTP-binding protein Rheb [Trichinella sp. T8]